MDEPDIAASAASITALLDRIDAGEIAATDEQRGRLEGALAVLAEIAGARRRR